MKNKVSASVLGVLFRVLRNQTGQPVGVQHCGGNSSHPSANVFETRAKDRALNCASTKYCFPEFQVLYCSCQ